MLLKKIALIFLLFSSILATAQITFQGVAMPVDSLNTFHNQNYLVINSSDGTMAFTEEQGGTASNELIKTFESNGIKIILFKDRLDKKGMSSPIGFFNDYLYFNEVAYKQGIYVGGIKKLSLQQSKISTVEIPFFTNKSSIQSGTISQDGNCMILSMESNHSYGVEDLYIIKRNLDGSWDRPKNLGYQINTQFQEITPFLAKDNRILFFATNGRGGEGSFDIFYTIRQDDSWNNWSEPINLGAKINTPGSETSFVYIEDAKWAFYVKSKDSNGYGDIVKIQFKGEIKKETKEAIKKDTSEVANDEKLEVISENQNHIILKIVDAKTGESLPSELLLANEYYSNTDGIFSIDSLTLSEIEIKSLGYLSKTVMLDSQLQIGVNLIKLSSLSKGNTIALNQVLFRRGTANMIPGSEKELDLLAEVMNENPTIEIFLKGHTDNTGYEPTNIALSEARVKTVKKYIEAQGIGVKRIKGKGFGGKFPIASNTTEETRKLNRRVEFEVLKD